MCVPCLTCTLQVAARDLSDKFSREAAATSRGSDRSFDTSTSITEVHSRSLNKKVPCICWICGSALETEYYWNQVNSMKVIRSHVKFGGPTIRALQACGSCLRDIMRRYSASRGNDYSLPVFCLAPNVPSEEAFQVHVAQEDRRGTSQVHKPGLPELHRAASAQLDQLADPEPSLPRSSQARDRPRAIVYDRQGNVLLDRDQ